MGKYNNVSFCAIVCAYGSYRQYAPLFTASMLTSFPNAFVRLYMRGVPEDCSKQLDMIAKDLSPRFDVVPDWSEKRFIHRELRTLRWFLDPEPLMQFKYCYWCDIDFIIMPIMKNLVQRHVGHMQQIGMPYSNSARRGRQGVWLPRMTGLHFVETKPYYAQTQHLFDRYTAIYLRTKANDERLLYKFLIDAFGTMPLELMEKHYFYPHHGFHLAKSRTPTYKYSPAARREMQLRYLRDYNRGHYLLHMAKNGVVGEIIRQMAKHNYQVKKAIKLAKRAVIGGK